MKDPILDDLNPQQLAAVTAPDGPLLIVAGAGSGKTRVITRRLAFLVRERGVRPYQIFAATFTNKAAQEMKHRVQELTPGYLVTDFHISTFHSLCARILRREASAIDLSPSFTICDDRDQVSAIRSVLRQMNLNEKTVKPGDVQQVINQCKMRMLGPDDVYKVTASDLEDTYAEVYREYQKYMRASSAVDFEDLILLVVELFRKNPEILQHYQQRYRHVMVDEYQDTNAVQVELVFQLASAHRNLAVVGDEDQCIYSWRGADITNLLEFQKHFPEASVVRLEQNYRSTGNILNAASSVIATNSERLGKTLFTSEPAGAPIYVLSAGSENEEAMSVARLIEDVTQRRGYSYSDIAIFYRVGALSRVLEDRMREFNFPYRVIGGIKFYDRAEIKDLISYLHVIQNPGNAIALLRIINSPRRGIGDKTIQMIIDRARRENVSEFEVMRRAVDDPDFPRGAAAKVKAFLKQLHDWMELAKESTITGLLQQVITDTGYIESLGDPKLLEVRSRTDNIEELKSAIMTFEREHPMAKLRDYLENVSLVSASDNNDEGGPAISLMTLHAAKGLEFKVVFMIGLEDGLFPNMRAVMEKGNYEEERRLFYVGMTRAREILVLSRSESRVWYGDIKANAASRFLRELPPEVVQRVERYASSLDESEPAELPCPVPKPRMRSGSVGSEDAPSLRTSVRGIGLGNRVRHPILGEGVVTAIKGSGDSVSYLLQLDDGDVLQVLARHARLELVEK